MLAGRVSVTDCHRPVPTAQSAPAASTLAVDAADLGDRLVLRLVGELDYSSSHLLTEARAASNGLGQSVRIDVDLSTVTFLDCAGLGALLALCRDESGQDQLVRITGRSRPVDRLLGLAGLDDSLDGAKAGSAL